LFHTSGDQFDGQLDYVDFNRYNIYDDSEDYIRRYISPIEGEPGIRNDEMIYNYIIRHPMYNDTTNDYDAILVLNESEAIDTLPNLSLNFNIDIPFKEQDLQVVGWGALEENGFGPDKPHQVTKSYISNEQCTSDPFQYEEGIITPRMLCAADIDGDDNEEDSCQGDSGGPLMTIPIDEEEEPVQVGIVSWGLGCARFPYTGVYSRIQPIQSSSQQTIRRRNTEELDDGLSWIVSTILERIGEDISPATTTTSSTVSSGTKTSSSTESPPSSSGTTVITTKASGGGTSTTTDSTLSTSSTTKQQRQSRESLIKAPRL